MTIEAAGYYWIYSEFTAPLKREKGPGTYTPLTAAAGTWTGPSKGSAALKTKAASHAERVAYDTMKGVVSKNLAFYLFVQNGFPCGECLDFFKAEAKERFFIFVITQDQGSYSMDNGFSGLKIAYPQIVYIDADNLWYPGFVRFWTHSRDPQNQRISTQESRLRSIDDAGIFKNGVIKKPTTWGNFPSIQDYVPATKK